MCCSLWLLLLSWQAAPRCTTVSPCQPSAGLIRLGQYYLIQFATESAQVVAVGDDVKLSLSKGDTVVFQKYAMAEVEIKEGEVIFVAEKSIMGVLHK